MHLQENSFFTFFELDTNVAQYPLHHVTCLGTKFGVATSNGLGGVTFTRNMTDEQTDNGLTWVQN